MALRPRHALHGGTDTRDELCGANRGRAWVIRRERKPWQTERRLDRAGLAARASQRPGTQPDGAMLKSALA